VTALRDAEPSQGYSGRTLPLSVKQRP
jgi:hypothetical protein